MAALFLPGAVEAQTARTLTLSATGNNGDRVSTAPGLQVHEGDTVTFTLTLSGLTDGNFTSAQTTFDGTATQGQDYTGATVSGVVLYGLRFLNPSTLSEGQTYTIADDSVAEPDETITLEVPTFSYDGTDTITRGDSITVTILANDGYAATTLAIGVDDANTAEGDTAEFTVTFTAGNPAPTYPVTVDWAVGGDVDSADHDATGGTLSFTAAGTRTINIGINADLEAEGAEDLTVTLSNQSSGVIFANAADNAATTAIAASPLARRLTLSGPANAEEGADATYAVTLEGTPFASPTLVTWTVTHTDTAAADFAAVTGSIMFPTMTGFSIGILDDDATAGGESAERFSVQISTADGPTVNAIGGAGVTTTIGGDDDPAAREARLEAPLASAGRGIGQLAAAAVVGRMAVAGSGPGGAGNSLTLAGRNITGMEALAAHYLAGGYATGARDLSAAELLRTSGFNLAGGDGGRGFNFWGQGEFVSAEGDHDGVDYDGDTSAFHLGIETGWKGGLVGVSVGRSSGDVDFTVTADGSKHELETEVTSVHPYLARRFDNLQVWVTAGHGTGDAEVVEPRATFKTDITVTTAAIGLRRAQDEQLSAGVSAIYTSAELDDAPGSQTLNAMTVDSLRVAASAEARWVRGQMSPYLDFTVRHDSGDGDTGLAGDVGGGLEWTAPGLVVRLAAATTVSSEASDETRGSLTVIKSTGNFDLGLNLATDSSGDFDTGRLLTGEWRF